MWRYHKYPDDCFRFSPKGIQVIFGQLNFCLLSLYYTYREGEFLSFTQDDGIDTKMAIMDDQGGKYLPYLQTVMVGTTGVATYADLYESYLGLQSPVQE